jgi:anti-sigma factor RsiW
MDCKYAPLLNRYADSELSGKERDFMGKHIKTCPVCEQEIKYIQLMKQRLSRNKIESNPDIFWQDVKYRLQRENFVKERENIVIALGNWSRKLIPVPVAVAIVAAIFLYSMPAKENIIDGYVFGTNFSNVYSQIEESASQSGLNTLLY